MKQKLPSSPFLAAVVIHYMLQFAAQHYVSSYCTCICFPLSQGQNVFRKHHHEPWPFFCQHIWCMYNLSMYTMYMRGWSKEVCTVFIVCSALRITHGMQLLWTLPRYMSYICIALTIRVLWFPVWCSEWIINVQRVAIFLSEEWGFCVKISQP